MEFDALNELAARIDTRVDQPKGDNPSAVSLLVFNPHPFAFRGPLELEAALDYRPIWKYTRRLPRIASHCTVMTNRGFAILGDRLFMATLDTRLVSLDAKTGAVIWDVAVDDYKKGFSITHAPLAIDGRSNSPAHAVAPLARPAACHKARRVSTPATWRL